MLCLWRPGGDPLKRLSARQKDRACASTRTTTGSLLRLPVPTFDCAVYLPSEALISDTSSDGISPTVVTSPSVIFHRRKGPVMSPY